MDNAKHTTSISLTWVTGERATALSHYVMKSTRGYAALRLRERETAEVLRAVPACGPSQSNPLPV